MWTAGTPLKDISHKICAEDSIPAELWSKNLPASSVFEREALPLDLVLFSALDLSYCERSGGEPMSHWLQVWFPLKGHPFSWDGAIQRNGNRGLASSHLSSLQGTLGLPTSRLHGTVSKLRWWEQFEIRQFWDLTSWSPELRHHAAAMLGSRNAHKLKKPSCSPQLVSKPGKIAILIWLHASW